MKRIALLLGIFLTVAMLFGCAAKPVTEPVAPESPAKPPEAKKAWEQEWEKIVRDAKKEGKVLIYTSIVPDIRVGVNEALKRKYGIDLEFTVGRPAELQQKLLTERKNEIYMSDMSILGLATYDLFKKHNILEKLDSLLVLSEVKDANAWFEGRVPFVGDEIVAFLASPTGHLAINTDMVKKDEIRFWRDLLNPKWKGKILVDDPTVPGPMNQQMAVLMERRGEDAVKELVKQEPILIYDSRLQAEWVARGKYPVALAPRDPVREMMRAGAPIAYQVVEDVIYLSGSASFIGVFKRAPHPNAVKVFVNWLLGHEGQTVYTRFSQYHSARVGVDESLVDPIKVRDPNIKYFSVISEEWDLKRTKYQPVIENIFAPLLKR